MSCATEGSFTSVRALSAAIDDYLAERNLRPKPYRWRADGAAILRRIEAARAAFVSKDTKGAAH